MAQSRKNVVASRRGTAEKPIKLEETVDVVPFGSEAHEQLIAIGYGGMTVAMAEQIIKERNERPELWPWDEYQKANAVLLQNAAVPIVVSTRSGWKRSEV